MTASDRKMTKLSGRLFNITQGNDTNNISLEDLPAVYGHLLRGYAIIAGILFLFGLVGNLWVICRISRLFFLKKCSKNRPPKISNQPSTNHIYIYIFCLSVADLFVLSVIPLLLADQAYTWIFGTLMCKYYYTMESLNKLMSVLILTALSCDRYLAVCHMFKFNAMRRPKFVMGVVGCCAAVAALLLMPIILTAG